MNKKIKTAIFAAALFSLGGAAYTYDRYGTQDNSMILANVEAKSFDIGEWWDEICEGVINLFSAKYEYKTRTCQASTGIPGLTRPGVEGYCVNGADLVICSSTPCQ